MPEHARVIYETLARENPSVTQFQSRLAMCFNNIGNEYYHLGQTAEALASLEQSCDIEDRLALANPMATDFQSERATSHYNISIILHATGQPAEALASLERRGRSRRS